MSTQKLTLLALIFFLFLFFTCDVSQPLNPIASDVTYMTWYFVYENQTNMDE